MKKPSKMGKNQALFVHIKASSCDPITSVSLLHTLIELRRQCTYQSSLVQEVRRSYSINSHAGRKLHS